MLKKTLLPCLMLCLLALPAKADELVDPSSFICAELVALTVSGLPPMFEALQIDGYSSAGRDNVIADPMIMQSLLVDTIQACENRPTDKVLAIWDKLSSLRTYDKQSRWKADTTTCGDYYEDEENGSGFVIWLDGYNRKKNKTKDSVFRDDATTQDFLNACKEKPKALVFDVLKESAR
jgi:hypothetical protein